MFMILMMVFTMVAGLFAYEPKKECAKIKRNGNVVYYEKTEPYNPLIWNEDYRDYVKWVIRKGYTVEQLVDYEYSLLESSRKGYYFSMEKAINQKPDSFEITITELINEKEYTRSSWLKQAKSDMTWAVTCLVFVTEENYLTLTKEEMYKKVNDFIEEVKAENR